MLENVRIDLARPGTGRIRQKTPFRTPGTTRNGPRFHEREDFIRNRKLRISVYVTTLKIFAQTNLKRRNREYSNQKYNRLK